MFRTSLLTLVFVAVCSANGFAQEPAEVPTIDSLAWLAGHWSGRDRTGRVTGEFWMKPDGGLMLGINRSVLGKSKASFEKLRIVQSRKKIIYVASPGGSGDTEFVLKESGEQGVTFENPENDFPQRIIYSRQGDTMKARIEGTVGGELQSMDWTWQLVAEEKPATPKEANGKTMLHGLRTVVYKVDDLEKAKKWYTAVLGFEPYFDQPFYVGYRVGGFELGLDPDMEGVTRGNNQPVYWGVDDCEKALAILMEKGASKDSEPQNVGEGIVVATVLDPFGNVFGIIQNPHFKIEE